MSVDAATAPEHTFLERLLDGIERFGDKLPQETSVVVLAVAWIVD